MAMLKELELGKVFYLREVETSLIYEQFGYSFFYVKNDYDIKKFLNLLENSSVAKNIQLDDKNKENFYRQISQYDKNVLFLTFKRSYNEQDFFVIKDPIIASKIKQIFGTILSFEYLYIASRRARTNGCTFNVTEENLAYFDFLQIKHLPTSKLKTLICDPIHWTGKEILFEERRKLIGVNKDLFEERILGHHLYLEYKRKSNNTQEDVMMDLDKLIEIKKEERRDMERIISVYRKNVEDFHKLISKKKKYSLSYAKFPRQKEFLLIEQIDYIYPSVATLQRKIDYLPNQYERAIYLNRGNFLFAVQPINRPKTEIQTLQDLTLPVKLK